MNLGRAFRKLEHFAELRRELRISDADARNSKLLDQYRDLSLIETSVPDRIKKSKAHRSKDR